MAFDLATIPQDVRIKRATLSMFTADRTNVQGFFAVVYPLLRPWSEVEATWMRARLGQPWQLPGANGANDRGFDPIYTQAIERLDGWVSFDITQPVQSWASEPITNYGLVIRGSTGNSVAYELLSSEQADTDLLLYRPELIITYWQPTPTATATVTSTSTPTPTATPTAPPSSTASPTLTPTPSPTLSPTLTPTPSDTPSVTPTPTITATATPLACQDAYEPDDDWTRSKLLVVGATPQARTFDEAGDVDYVKVAVQQGQALAFYTTNLAEGMDTTLTLYDTDGVTVLMRNDDDPMAPPASRIEWLAPTTGTYFLKVANFDPSLGGCAMTYGLAVIRIPGTPTPTPTKEPVNYRLFVPMLRR